MCSGEPSATKPRGRLAPNPLLAFAIRFYFSCSSIQAAGLATTCAHALWLSPLVAPHLRFDMSVADSGVISDIATDTTEC
jgi:hypothetical protein